MNRKSGNIAASAVLPSRMRLNLTLASALLSQHGVLNPNYFLTVQLYHPRDRRTPRWLNTNERQSQLFAGRAIIKGLDKAIYGGAVRRILAPTRFPYFMRLETASKCGIECPGHFHILLKLNPIEEAYLLTRRAAMEKCIQKRLHALHFQPDLLLEKHDGQNCSYVTKYPYQDVSNFFTRNLPIKA